jgi:hypothetical protein
MWWVGRAVRDVRDDGGRVRAESVRAASAPRAHACAFARLRTGHASGLGGVERAEESGWASLAARACRSVIARRGTATSAARPTCGAARGSASARTAGAALAVRARAYGRPCRGGGVSARWSAVGDVCGEWSPDYGPRAVTLWQLDPPHSTTLTTLFGTLLGALKLRKFDPSSFRSRRGCKASLTRLASRSRIRSLRGSGAPRSICNISSHCSVYGQDRL